MDKKTKKQKIGKSILLMLLCILINFLGKYAAASLQLPVWLDVVGTCVAAYFLGPFGGVIAGVTNNLFFGVLNPAAVAYMLTSVAVGLLFGYCAKKGYLENFTKCMVSSFLVGVFSVVVSTPLNLLFYQGKCGNVWGDALFDMLDWYGMPRWLCSVAGEAVVDIIDKQLCVALAFFIIRGIQRGRKRLFKGASEAALFLAVVAAPFCVPAVFAGAFVSQESPEFFDCHIGTVYDSRSGMPSSEANIIAETEDGYIWIGSYAGLTRYDGTDFEFIREGGITSITSMMTDRQGRLWVGTNDGGIARYESGVPTFFTVQDGLPANSIRTFAEDADGTVYVGTTDRICRIEADDTVHVLKQEVEYVTSLTVYDGALLGVTNLGELFCIRDGELLRMPKAGQGNVYHTCISVTEQGILAGTSADYVEKLRITDEGIVAEKQISTGELSRIADIGSDSQGRTWLCAENGFGYLDAEGRLQTKHYEGFDRSMECVHEDYEGNIWIASSRYGVMKFSENQFTDLFSVVGAEAAVTNAVIHYNGAYYCGTDNGLVILDETGKQEVRNELTRLLEKERVRSLMVDSADRLWICTYGGAGLVRYTADGSITVFGEADGTTGTRFRCIEELSDGTIAVGTSAGITFICGDTVTGTVTTEDGLGNSQILCLLEGADGTLYAGSDGAGLYALKDQKIVENYTVADGLTSDVILRIAAYKQGFFIVASNSLCYMDESGIEPLRHFPYFNNYDIILDEGKAYVLSSAGIYVTEAEALRIGQRFCYKLYNNSDGLFGALTANSWNCIEPDGRLLLCCNNGVTGLRLHQEKERTAYKFGISSVLADGEEIREEDGAYTIPSGAKRIYIKASLRNYALLNVKVRFYIKELEENPQVVSQHALEPIQISNLQNGTYTVRFEILSDDESTVLQGQSYTLHKGAQFWENPWYIGYLIVVGIWIVAFITWSVVMLVSISKRKKELEELRKELENTVQVQTGEIIRQAEKMENFQWSVIESMASLIEGRDGNTGEHVRNTRSYVSVIAHTLLERGMYPDIVTQKYVECLIRVAPLHDVGKIRISDMILNKPGRFTPEEYEEMKKHTTYGAEIAGDILGKDADPQMRQMVEEVAHYHHEKWNGTGYPTGKKGEEIPLSARIMAIADVFDALVSKRVYKEAIPVEKAFEILREEAGQHFDATLVEVFLSEKELIKSMVH